ncbi:MULTISPECIES: HAMP domain-containing sensor histidine kinase [Cryobacterium]|uniref:histidine kinase n=1 Tax=Cryobacterium glucosi TaxID=1259175 RepID=A0ABY2IMM7_9MICO|nr:MULTISPECIES: HAMP domain-containing sensor histidine kinase [Cryobacterium]MEB0287432.1 HAMP domain-containing sensor histidine kinase [Cryobacterium sp. 10S3]MEB0305498.1 HAMP domain-containing sensor histidine kinase [Cryobacterium sp. 10I1]TFB98281.1 HAMP domain-containing histidine kinase [Cryobacterium sp. MDB2-A-1]TFC06112.1 HAMP domain-containing histidine kinase [Cryobacterium sp. MDB2-33-2]TFC13704.1 HAMP domain-containing histidine kinase [Cryobacterium sp. MDB2-A-2]
MTPTDRPDSLDPADAADPTHAADAAGVADVADVADRTDPFDPAGSPARPGPQHPSRRPQWVGRPRWLRRPLWLRPGRAPWTLRRRLVLAVVGLLALVSISIGVVSVTVLRANLLAGLDQQVSSAAERSHSMLEGRRDNDLGAALPVFVPSASVILNGPGQPGTLALVFYDSTLTAGYTDDTGTIVALTAHQVDLLVQKADILASQTGTAQPVTVDLGGDVGNYRILASSSRTGTLSIVGLPLSTVDGTATQLAMIIGVVSLVGIIVVAILAMWIVRLALRPLQRVTATAARVSELPLDRGEVSLVDRVPAADTDPRTEVGQVGSALNRMLDHVDLALETRQASENKVRQFVADASHELRTPLASIRGYSELTRRSGQELPPDALHALSRIESESVRMTGLVEDLLLLARLDEGRELEHGTVDLTSLLVDVVSDAHAAGRDRVLNLELPDEPIQAIGDTPRLHQVFTNLLANARIHTPPDTTVEVALSEQDGRAIVTVTDDGPGIPANLQTTLFERFARGDSSRFRGTGSTGLGLAIVQAVVTAHQGEVTVSSRPGRTEFRVSLPLA